MSYLKSKLRESQLHERIQSKVFFLSLKSITSWESIVKFPMDQSKEISGVLASKKVAFGARALMEIHVYCGLPTMYKRGNEW